MTREISKSVIVRAPAGEVFRIWEDLENLPKFMKNLVSVRKISDHTSRWTARGPLGVEVQWDVETTLVEPGKRIAWNTRKDEIITTTGQVTFNQLQDGQTEVTVTMNVVPKGGLVADALLTLLSNPSARLDDDLRAFKQNVEQKHRSAERDSAASAQPRGP
jgi:uncharacterized membrane protein